MDDDLFSGPVRPRDFEHRGHPYRFDRFDPPELGGCSVYVRSCECTESAPCLYGSSAGLNPLDRPADTHVSVPGHGLDLRGDVEVNAENIAQGGGCLSCGAEWVEGPEGRHLQHVDCDYLRACDAIDRAILAAEEAMR